MSIFESVTTNTQISLFFLVFVCHCLDVRPIPISSVYNACVLGVLTMQSCVPSIEQWNKHLNIPTFISIISITRFVKSKRKKGKEERKAVTLSSCY
jgi:hypothetical protein